MPASAPDRDPKPRRLVASNAVFFPMATLYAIVVLPASVLAMLGLAGSLPALASASGHGHEMLFGFALAVIVGNQVGPIAVPRLAWLAGLWLAARAMFLYAPQSIAAAAANIAFAALLATHFAPRVPGAAKKWRNQALPLVLTAICGCSIAFELARQAGFAGAEHTLLGVSVLLFAMLLLFMGGRLIGPTVAGEIFRQGGKLDARVQPGIEGGLIIVMTIAAAALLLASWRPFELLAAAATAVAGALSALRLSRWRPWALRARPDLLCLAAGYGWLALGLLLYAAALGIGRYQAVALHVITVGALGTLTLNVMAMTWTLKARQDPSRARVRVTATVLLGAAVLARVLAGLETLDPQTMLVIAAMLWSSAFALLLALLGHLRRPRRARADA